MWRKCEAKATRCEKYEVLVHLESDGKYVFRTRFDDMTEARGKLRDSQWKILPSYVSR